MHGIPVLMTVVGFFLLLFIIGFILTDPWHSIYDHP